MSRIPRILGLNLWESPTGDRTEPDLTLQVRDWQPEPFAVLVARGHNLSPGVFALNAPGKTVISIGRDDNNDLIIQHQAISRQHAVIRHLEDRFVVQDLGSTSGTFVSYSGDLAREIEITGRINAIKDGSMLRFGPAGYTFLHHT
jgi:pSer/pThr/pTyr-binding forkhead associated (FHA) protein